MTQDQVIAAHTTEGPHLQTTELTFSIDTTLGKLTYMHLTVPQSIPLKYIFIIRKIILSIDVTNYILSFKMLHILYMDAIMVEDNGVQLYMKKVIGNLVEGL